MRRIADEPKEPIVVDQRPEAGMAPGFKLDFIKYIQASTLVEAGAEALRSPSFLVHRGLTATLFTARAGHKLLALYCLHMLDIGLSNSRARGRHSVSGSFRPF